MKVDTSRIVLGTAQLGRHYGIANTTGNPGRRKAIKILETAWNAGIRMFDTAPGYESESILGEFIAAEGLSRDAKVAAKIPAIGNRADCQEFISRSIENSLSKLGTQSIEVLYFHAAADIHWLRDDAVSFFSLFDEYPIRSWGISIYDYEDLLGYGDAAADMAIQFPFNLIDRRFENNSFPQGRRFARSIFQQGLLAADRLRPDAPMELNNFHQRILQDSHQMGFSLKQLSLSFLVNQPCFDFFLVGAESSEQVRDIIDTELVDSVNFDALSKRWGAYMSRKWMDPRQWTYTAS